MPNRILKESIKTSPEIDKLSWFEESVFYRLMITVDDYGCFDGRVIVIKNELFPTKENVTTKAVGDAIEKLERVNLLRRYEVEGRPYIALSTWEEHQRVRNKHRKYPEPPLDIHLSANRGQLTANCQSESESNPNPNKKNIKKKFTPPTLNEIANYCAERKNGVDPKRFYDYYSTGEWKDAKGNPIVNWKQKMIAVWEKEPQNISRRSDIIPTYDESVNTEFDEKRFNEIMRQRKA